jgi:hypothetical protein
MYSFEIVDFNPNPMKANKNVSFLIDTDDCKKIKDLFKIFNVSFSLQFNEQILLEQQPTTPPFQIFVPIVCKPIYLSNDVFRANMPDLYEFTFKNIGSSNTRYVKLVYDNKEITSENNNDGSIQYSAGMLLKFTMTSVTVDKLASEIYKQLMFHTFDTDISTKFVEAFTIPTPIQYEQPISIPQYDEPILNQKEVDVKLVQTVTAERDYTDNFSHFLKVACGTCGMEFRNLWHRMPTDEEVLAQDETQYLKGAHPFVFSAVGKTHDMIVHFSRKKLYLSYIIHNTTDRDVFYMRVFNLAASLCGEYMRSNIVSNPDHRNLSRIQINAMDRRLNRILADLKHIIYVRFRF